MHKVYRIFTLFEITSWFLTYMFGGFTLLSEILTPNIFAGVQWKILGLLLGLSLLLCVANLILESIIVINESKS